MPLADALADALPVFGVGFEKLVAIGPSHHGWAVAGQIAGYARAPCALAGPGTQMGVGDRPVVLHTRRSGGAVVGPPG